MCCRNRRPAPPPESAPEEESYGRPNRPPAPNEQSKEWVVGSVFCGNYESEVGGGTGRRQWVQRRLERTRLVFGVQGMMGWLG